jgi:hypothetical protein
MKRLLHCRLCLAAIVVAPSACRAAIDIQFDYTYNSSSFFSGANVGRRALLDAAAGVFEERLTEETFGAIVPSGSNTWTLSFPNPATGTTVTLNNPILPANTVTIYAGSRDLAGTLIGQANYSYTYFGNAGWVNLFQSRDSNANFDSMGGAISFDPLAPFYFDDDPETLESFPEQYDFYTVAQHEIAHLLGFTYGANAFRADTSGTNFVGPAVTTLYGAPAPLASGDPDHWSSVLASGAALMTPTFYFNERKTPTPIDFAVLKDIGYKVGPLGDYNLSGTVDAADYTLWRNSLGQVGTNLLADGDGDNRIDLDDYGVWRNQYGVFASTSGANARLSPLVPEPLTATLVLTGLLFLAAVHPPSTARPSALR